MSDVVNELAGLDSSQISLTGPFSIANTSKANDTTLLQLSPLDDFATSAATTQPSANDTIGFSVLFAETKTITGFALSTLGINHGLVCDWLIEAYIDGAWVAVSTHQNGTVSVSENRCALQVFSFPNPATYQSSQWRVSVTNYDASSTAPTAIGELQLLSGGGEPPLTDPYWDNVSLLMHCDGANGSTTFVDETGKTVTASGGAAISTAQSKFGGASAYFDGAGDWITVPYSADFDFGPGDVTVECWLHPTAIPSVAADIATTNGASNGWGLRIGPDLRPRFIWSIGGTSSEAYAASAIPLNAWSHIAGVRAGSNTYIFINGQLSGTTPCGTGAQNVTNAPLTIGRNNTNASWYYTGYIDEVRITKGFARYTSAFTPPTEPFSNTGAQPLIDAIASGQLTPSPLSNLLLANWPLVGVEASGALTPSGFLVVNNPQIIDGLLSGTMSPSGSVLVSSYWLIEAVASGRLSPSEAAHILIDNLDPGAMQFAQIVGELELYSEVIRSAQLAGKIELFGTMSVTPEHEAQVAGMLQLIDGEASFCGCGNG